MQTAAQMTRVYLSSTYQDLKDHREAVYHVLRKLELDCRAMEDDFARDDLLLLYFAGHGVIDEHRRLTLALNETDPDYRSSGIGRAFCATRWRQPRRAASPDPGLLQRRRLRRGARCERLAGRASGGAQGQGPGRARRERHAAILLRSHQRA